MPVDHTQTITSFDQLTDDVEAKLIFQEFINPHYILMLSLLQDAELVHEAVLPRAVLPKDVLLYYFDGTWQLKLAVPRHQDFTVVPLTNRVFELVVLLNIGDGLQRLDLTEEEVVVAGNFH